ncbi:hypothetical protein EYC84_007799 [Monilinia fructicola]|uniref:Uncharacterized protein n=1 Tax=Monilinia fructicola TaxID=38448 RepID=A0A5M9JM30_MONFR|nr:hypothetical protein EYC84_007799 [Monilinia fructicola]
MLIRSHLHLHTIRHSSIHLPPKAELPTYLHLGIKSKENQIQPHQENSSNIIALHSSGLITTCDFGDTSHSSTNTIYNL